MSTRGELSTRTIATSLGAGVAVLLLLAFGLGRGDAPVAGDVLDLPAASVDGAQLPGLVRDGSPDPATGAAAPILTGPALAGGDLTVGAGDDPTIVLFLAHWCPHCQREAPVVRAWLDAGGLAGSGVDLVGVATGIDPAQPNFPPDAWLDRIGWTAPTLVDNDGAAASAYGVTSFPFWVVVEDGEVLARFSGALGADGLDALVAGLSPGGP